MYVHIACLHSHALLEPGPECQRLVIVRCRECHPREAAVAGAGKPCCCLVIYLHNKTSFALEMLLSRVKDSDAHFDAFTSELQECEVLTANVRFIMSCTRCAKD